MNLIRLLLILFFTLTLQSVSFAEDDWRDSDMNSTEDYFARCIEPPEVININEGNFKLDLNDSGKWIPANIHVDKGKFLGFSWSTKNIIPRPKKYRILYRIDPRFPRPQLFIQQYDYGTKSYLSDFHRFNNGDLLDYQNTSEMDLPGRIALFQNYFKYETENRISVKKGDVVNITLSDSATYFGLDSEMQSELGSYSDDLLLFHTTSAITDNRIIYTNVDRWCNEAVTPAKSSYCTNNNTVYRDLDANWNSFVGHVDSSIFNQYAITACPSGVNDPDNSPICYYDNARGVSIKVAGTEVKSEDQQFLTKGSATSKYFFYFDSDVDGYLDISTSWPVSSIYGNSVFQYQQMSNWNFANNYNDFIIGMIGARDSFYMNYLHFGRYFFDVEIGSGSNKNAISSDDYDSIQLEYKIVEDSGSIADSQSGTVLDKDTQIDAPETGYLFIKVINPREIEGSIELKTKNYKGSTWFSTLIFEDIVTPLRSKFRDLSTMLYYKFSNDASLYNIARVMLTLYILLYGLMFVAGAVQVTVTDVAARVAKIAIIMVLFSETSWEFFNNNLFTVFLDGTDYLLKSVVSATSSTSNVFGFVDPIIDKYTDKNIWFLLLIQLLQFYNGMSFFVLVVLYSLTLYFKGLLEVIVGYIMAFLSFAVMISLAPLFILLLLFERTKPIFDNWISTMFNYMIQPTLLLIFFLIVDQIISDQITNVVVESCWGSLVDLKISLSLKHLKLPWSFTSEVPGLPDIKFYIPMINFNDIVGPNGNLMKIATSSLILFVLAKLTEGVVSYVDELSSTLTNAIAARQDGARQDNNIAASSIVGDIRRATKPFTEPAYRFGRGALIGVVKTQYRVAGGVIKGVARGSFAVSKGVIKGTGGILGGIGSMASGLVRGLSDPTKTRSDIADKNISKGFNSIKNAPAEVAKGLFSGEKALGEETYKAAKDSYNDIKSGATDYGLEVKKNAVEAFENTKKFFGIEKNQNKENEIDKDKQREKEKESKKEKEKNGKNNKENEPNKKNDLNDTNS